DSGGPFVGADFAPRLQNRPFGDTKRFALSHKLLPRLPAVDSLNKNWMTRSLRAARRRINARPLAVPAGYGRSSLLRIIPPLCLADERNARRSVLSASRGFRLCLSLCIDSTSSTQARRQVPRFHI